MSKKIAKTAIIAGIYFVLTIAIAPLSYGVVQFRFSECLTVLAIFYPEAVVGLTIGCFFSNLFGNGILDIIFGTLATFLSSFATFLIGKKLKSIGVKTLICIVLNVLLNAILVPISFITYTNVFQAYFFGMLMVALGQIGVLCTLGVAVALAVDKFSKKSDYI